MGLVSTYNSKNGKQFFKTQTADNSVWEIGGYKFKLRLISKEWSYLKLSPMTLHKFILLLRALLNSDTINFKSTPANEVVFLDDDGTEWKIKIVYN